MNRVVLALLLLAATASAQTMAPVRTAGRPEPVLCPECPHNDRLWGRCGGPLGLAADRSRPTNFTVRTEIPWRCDRGHAWSTTNQVTVTATQGLYSVEIDWP